MGYSVKKDLKEIEWKNVEWIHLAQFRGH